MTIYRSYSDFTTKGGGVIEGLGGGRKGKTGPVYSKVSSIPKTHKLLRVVDKLSGASPYLTNMDAGRQQRLIKDLELGYIIKIRDGIYIKPVQFGKFEVYHDDSKPLPKAELRPAKLTKQQRKRQAEDIYQHLLNIQQNAKKNKEQ